MCMCSFLVPRYLTVFDDGNGARRMRPAALTGMLNPGLQRCRMASRRKFCRNMRVAGPPRCRRAAFMARAMPTAHKDLLGGYVAEPLRGV